jgi:anti-anti-sigma factor
MAFHFLCHSWQVKDVVNGIMVTVTQHELNPDNVADLDDELLELARESGQYNCYLDLSDVRFLGSAALGKLISLDAMLRKIHSRLILCNIDPVVYRSLQATPLAENIDRVIQPAGVPRVDQGLVSDVPTVELGEAPGMQRPQ